MLKKIKKFLANAKDNDGKQKGGHKIKKILLFFLLCLLPFCIFAQTLQTSTIVVRSTVSKITLSNAATAGEGMLSLYKLYGGLDSANNAGLDSLIADDISEGDIKVYFRIAQLAKTRTDETISISVEAESLVNIESEYLISRDPTAVVSTPQPVISDISCLDMDCLKVTGSQTNNGVDFYLAYHLCKSIENINLAFFTATWKKTEGLAPGEYTSNITMSYITN